MGALLWLTEPDAKGGRRTVPDSVRRVVRNAPSPRSRARRTTPRAARRWRRLLRELAALGYAPDDVGVCLGDGADWLRRLYAEWFPGAVRIVDFFHAAEYLWAAARARYGPYSDLARRWAMRLCRLLKAGRADDVLAALHKAGAVEECARAAGYIAARRGQMRYNEYRARGLPIGSGRPRRPARPSSTAANPVLWVRCAHLSGWFDDYGEDRLGMAA